MAVLAFLVVATPIGGHITEPDSAWQPLVKSGLYAVAATLALAPVALGDQGWYHRLLSSRPMVWLGEISYEIFLLHVVVMALAMNLVLQWPLFTGSLPGLYLTTLAITIPLAMVLRLLTDPNVLDAARVQTSARKAGTSSESARPRWDNASFSCGLNSAADFPEPVGRNTGS
jgi:peptidoglycan/LPS O-acetylase OafA/YrhL